MKNQGEKSFMEKLSEQIVDKRNIIIFFYLAAIIFSVFSQSWVKVCNDITQYLPASTETRRGLTLMDEEFVTYASARVMVANITYDKAEELQVKLESIPQVNMIDFDNTEDHYKDASALFDVTLNTQGVDERTKEGYQAIRDALDGYDVFI